MCVCYLSGVCPAWKDKVGYGTSVSWPASIGANGNGGVAGYVQKAANSIGYVESAYAKQNNLTYMMLKNSAGQFVEPSFAFRTARSPLCITLTGPERRRLIIELYASDLIVLGDGGMSPRRRSATPQRKRLMSMRELQLMPTLRLSSLYFLHI